MVLMHGRHLVSVIRYMTKVQKKRNTIYSYIHVCTLYVAVTKTRGTCTCTYHQCRIQKLLKLLKKETMNVCTLNSC